MIVTTRLILCGLVGLAALVNGKFAPTEQFSHSATLRSGNIKVYWNFNDTHITFEVHGETTAWIGIGFSPNGAMTGADIFVGWVKNGEVRVTDRHGVGNTFRVLDPKQDIHVLGGSGCDGWTMFKFTRQLAACEDDYDREVTQNTQRLIWAWGNTDPKENDIEPSDYHGAEQKGVESMYFLRSVETPTGLPKGPTYNTIDTLMDNFEIPAVETYYNCKLFKFPQLSKKHHIVKYEPIIQEGNELHVHHILVHRCGDVLENPNELGKDGTCYVANMQHFATCGAVVAEWAVGGSATIYPENAGFSIGAEGDPVYIQIEIHYDNPAKKSGVIDSSGIRFTYTDTIRQYDVGVLMVGTRIIGSEHFIPPGAESFLTGYCTADCLEKGMTASNVQDVNVFSIMLHTHLAGISVKLRHIRNATELLPPAYDDYYDFNYQEAELSSTRDT